MIEGLMSPKHARLTLALLAKIKGVQPRTVDTEAERQKMQALEKGDHVWKIGDEYISLEDVKRA